MVLESNVEDGVEDVLDARRPTYRRDDGDGDDERLAAGFQSSCCDRFSSTKVPRQDRTSPPYCPLS